MKNKYIFTDELAKFIKDNVKGRLNSELVILVKSQLGIDVTESQLENFKHRNHLRSGLCCQFKKGHISWNKGKHIELTDAQRATTFKKGHKSYNAVPIGTVTTRLNKYEDSYRTYIKVSKDKWQLYNRYLWEQEHNEKLGRNDYIIFLDGNRDNFSVDNLAKVTRYENLKLNKAGMRFNDPEATKTCINIAKLDIAIGKRAKGNE